MTSRLDMMGLDMMCFQTNPHYNFTDYVQNAVCFLKIPTLGAFNSVWQMLFQALEEILTLELKVAQITNVQVPFPAQHIPLQGFNTPLCNLITGINNRGQLVQG
jgi:hypothetical protein